MSEPYSIISLRVFKTKDFLQQKKKRAKKMILENFQNLHEDGCLECRYDVKAFENSCLSEAKTSENELFYN